MTADVSDPPRRRIYELKDRVFAALWAIFAAAMIGVFGFISRMLWDLYGDRIIGGLNVEA